MAQSLSTRRVHGAGKGFGIFMIAVVVFLVLLMLYFKNHSGPSPVPARPTGIFGQLASPTFVSALGKWTSGIDNDVVR
jgi:hypothetical protein